MKKRVMNKRGQIWVETVIYTLIALVIIGLVLGFVKPRIQEMQDRAVIEQSIVMLENINSYILSLEKGGEGNKRLIELGLKKGLLKIDGGNDALVFEMEGKNEYSEPGEDVQYGKMVIRTDKIGKDNKVSLTMDYNTEYNITYQGKDELKTLTKSNVPYKLFITNKGESGDLTLIDFELS